MTIAVLIFLFLVIALTFAMGSDEVERGEALKVVREYLIELRADATNGFDSLTPRDWQRFIESLIDRHFVVLVTMPALMNALGRLANELARLAPREGDDLLPYGGEPDLPGAIGECERLAAPARRRSWRGWGHAAKRQGGR